MKTYNFIMMIVFFLVFMNAIIFGEDFLRLPFRPRLLIGSAVFLVFAVWILIGKLIDG